MRRVSRRIGLIAIGVSLLSMSTVEAVTVRMVVVGVNGVKLGSPTSSVNLVGGDSFEAEILISGWGLDIPDLITWQVSVDNQSILIPDPPAHCDRIVPLHFDDGTFLRPSGAFMNQRGDPTGNGRGVCDATSANAGDSCVNAPVVCRPMCIGGTTEGALCDNGCPGGGVCSSSTCVDSICSENTFASDRGRPCATPTNQCIGGACDSRSDFIMAGVSAICAVSTFQDNYRYGCAVLGLNGIPDPGGEFYAGTLLLQVKPDATGTFTLGAENSTATFFSSVEGLNAPVTSVPLEVVLPPCGVVGACCGAIVGLDVPLVDVCSITQETTCIAAGGAYQGDNTDCTDTNPAGVCSCPQVVSSVPPNCAVDARYPQDQGGPPLPRRGLDSVQVTFDTNLSEVITSSDIAFQTACPGFGQAAIDTITPIGGNTIQVDFNRPMAMKTWVCLRFCGDEANQVCWGRLPADVNGDGTAGPGDILEIIDGLNGLVQQGEWQCDVDLSTQCGAPDILGVIDLLNGAGFSQAWNGVSLCTTCPTAP